MQSCALDGALIQLSFDCASKKAVTARPLSSNFKTFKVIKILLNTQHSFFLPLTIKLRKNCASSNTVFSVFLKVF